MISSDIDYPAGLPNPLREGHSLQMGETLVRTNLASGRARQRLGFENVPVEGTWNFLFTDQEASLFEAWHRYTLKSGVEWFNIQRKTPLGMRTLTCRFTAAYSGPSLVGRSLWRYACPLEIFERETMPPEWIDFPDYWLQPGISIFDIAMNREWPEA